MNLNDIISSPQGSQAIGALGQRLGLSPEQAQAAAQALIPALSVGLQHAAQSPGTMGEILGHLTDDTHQATFNGTGDAPAANAAGQSAVGTILGNDAITSQIAELSGLAAQMLRNSNGMGSIKTPTGAPTVSNSSASHENSSVSAALPEKDLAKVTEGKKEDLDLKADERVAAAQAKAAAKKAKDYSLKNGLVAKLAAGEASAKANGLAGNDKGEAGKDSTSAVSAKAPAASVTEQFLGSPANNNFQSSPGSRCSMAGSETDAEVKRLVESEAGRGLASVETIQSEGILDVDSTSLFERVKSHLNSCLRQRCVTSKYAPK
jgi:hypothetical protein